MKLFSLVTVLFFINIAYGQLDPSIKFAEIINKDDLKKHLSIIVGEEMEGRETGTAGQKKAAQYIETQFKELGLQAPENLNGYQQYYPLFKDSLLKVELEIGDKIAEYGKDFISPANHNESGTFESKSIVFAGYGIKDKNYNDYAGLNVKGKVVLIFLGEPKVNGKFLITGTTKGSDWTFPGLSMKLSLAAKLGAVGALVINPTQETFNQRTIDNSRKTNLYFPREEEKGLNYALISHAFVIELWGQGSDTLLKKAKSYGVFSPKAKYSKKINIEMEYEKTRVTIEASNVVGIVEGTDKKDEYLMLTAHYDHLGIHDGKIYYGADDDGSGTVAVIQMAAAFAKAKAEGRGPRRTVVFMTVSGEEKGLWGSEYYSDHPLFPLKKTTADLNIDMVGRVDTERMSADTLNYVYVVGHNKISSELPAINEGANKKYTNLILDYKFDEPDDPNQIYYRSDHYNFARKGVPVLFFYDGMLQSDYHRPTDTVDKIYWELYEKRVRMIFYTAWEMANREKMLLRDLPNSDSHLK